MMDIDVDDRHMLEAARDRMRRGNGHVVVETEAHGAIALRVVTRRPHERKCGVAVLERICDSRYELRDFRRLRRGECVRIEHHRTPRSRGN